MAVSFDQLRQELLSCSNRRKAKVLRSFFKTAAGQYAEGDIFLGIAVGKLRRIAAAYPELKQRAIIRLLRSKIHEERFLALLFLTQRYSCANEQLKEKIFQLYLDNIEWVNSWDLVDMSAPRIIGAHLANKKNKELLYRLAASRSFWQRRIAIVATWYFIKQGKFADTFRITKRLFEDEQDLVHKAAGWMLREVGKHDFRALEQFLRKYHRRMPSLMLRYAIERFPERLRQAYLKSKARKIS